MANAVSVSVQSGNNIANLSATAITVGIVINNVMSIKPFVGTQPVNGVTILTVITMMRDGSQITPFVFYSVTPTATLITAFASASVSVQNLNGSVNGASATATTIGLIPVNIRQVRPFTGTQPVNGVTILTEIIMRKEGVGAPVSRERYYSTTATATVITSVG